jgi:ABC-type glycerol-3-phosphate transport system permease component
MNPRTRRRLRRARRKFVGELPVHLFLLPPVTSVLFLLYYLASNTLKPLGEFYRSDLAFPHSISLHALDAAAHDGGMLLALRNSVILTSLTVLISVLIGAAAAFALSRLHLRFKQVTFVAMLVPMSISPMIVTIPLFAQLSKAGLIDTFTGGVLVYVGLRLSFTIYVLEGIFRELPDELFESARIDGAGDTRVFWGILLPLAGPGLAAVSLMNMLEVWNDLLIGLLFLSSPDVIPISANVVSFQQKFSADPQMVFAGLFLAALPMLVIYLVAQRYFVRGLMGGAFK